MIIATLIIHASILAVHSVCLSKPYSHHTQLKFLPTIYEAECNEKTQKFICRNVPGYGSCLFYALSACITFDRTGYHFNCSHKKMKELAKNLRQIAVDILRSNEQDIYIENNEMTSASNLLQLVSDHENKTPEEYCNHMLKSSTWGGGTEMAVLSHYLKRPIHVFQLQTGRKWFIFHKYFKLKLYAEFSSPKYENQTPYYILSADGRFPHILPGQQKDPGDHFLALFPISQDDIIKYKIIHKLHTMDKNERLELIEYIQSSDATSVISSTIIPPSTTTTTSLSSSTSSLNTADTKKKSLFSFLRMNSGSSTTTSSTTTTTTTNNNDNNNNNNSKIPLLKNLFMGNTDNSNNNHSPSSSSNNNKDNRSVGEELHVYHQVTFPISILKKFFRRTLRRRPLHDNDNNDSTSSSSSSSSSNDNKNIDSNGGSNNNDNNNEIEKQSLSSWLITKFTSKSLSHYLSDISDKDILRLYLNCCQNINNLIPSSIYKRKKSFAIQNQLITIASTSLSSSTTTATTSTTTTTTTSNNNNNNSGDNISVKNSQNNQNMQKDRQELDYILHSLLSPDDDDDKNDEEKEEQYYDEHEYSIVNTLYLDHIFNV